MDKKLPNTTVDIHLIRGLSELYSEGTPARVTDNGIIYLPEGSGLKMRLHTLTRLVENGWLEVFEGVIKATSKGLDDLFDTESLVEFKKADPDYLKIVNRDDETQSVYCYRCLEESPDTPGVRVSVDGWRIWDSTEGDDFKAGAVAAARHFVHFHKAV